MNIPGMPTLANLAPATSNVENSCRYNGDAGRHWLLFFLRPLDLIYTSFQPSKKTHIKSCNTERPKVFRRNLNCRCAMQAGSLELGTLRATSSRQGKYIMQKGKTGGKDGVYIGG
jgi:hypothetical protein